MDSAVWSVVSALDWGSADFIARFTGRKLGPDVALFGMLLVGGTTLTDAVLAIGLPPPGATLDWALVVASGTAVLVGTFLLYEGLARGPVTIVAPSSAPIPCSTLRSVSLAAPGRMRCDDVCLARRLRRIGRNFALSCFHSADWAQAERASRRSSAHVTC